MIFKNAENCVFLLRFRNLTEYTIVKMIPEIDIKDYNYDLPDEKIAKYPLSERDMSKLLVYKNAEINEYRFTSMPEQLPEGHLMVFNDTKVVPARLHFQRETGAHIEIFCLEPVQPEEYVSMFAVTDRCRWKCIVGNVKRWKGDTLHLYNPESSQAVAAMDLKADLIERNGEIVFATKNGEINCLRSSDGELLWKHKIGNSIINTMVPVGERDWVLTTTDGVVARISVR